MACASEDESVPPLACLSAAIWLWMEDVWPLSCAACWLVMLPACSFRATRPVSAISRSAAELRCKVSAGTSGVCAVPPAAPDDKLAPDPTALGDAGGA